MFSEITCPKCGHRFETGWVRWRGDETIETECIESYFDICPK